MTSNSRDKLELIPGTINNILGWPICLTTLLWIDNCHDFISEELRGGAGAREEAYTKTLRDKLVAPIPPQHQQSINYAGYLFEKYFPNHPDIKAVKEDFNEFKVVCGNVIRLNEEIIRFKKILHSSAIITGISGKFGALDLDSIGEEQLLALKQLRYKNSSKKGPGDTADSFKIIKNYLIWNSLMLNYIEDFKQTGKSIRLQTRNRTHLCEKKSYGAKQNPVRIFPSRTNDVQSTRGITKTMFSTVNAVGALTISASNNSNNYRTVYSHSMDMIDLGEKQVITCLQLIDPSVTAGIGTLKLLVSLKDKKTQDTYSIYPQYKFDHPYGYTISVNAWFNKSIPDSRKRTVEWWALIDPDFMLNNVFVQVEVKKNTQQTSRPAGKKVNARPLVPDEYSFFITPSTSSGKIEMDKKIATFKSYLDSIRISYDGKIYKNTEMPFSVNNMAKKIVEGSPGRTPLNPSKLIYYFMLKGFGDFSQFLFARDMWDMKVPLIVHTFDIFAASIAVSQRAPVSFFKSGSTVTFIPVGRAVREFNKLFIEGENSGMGKKENIKDLLRILDDTAFKYYAIHDFIKNPNGRYRKYFEHGKQLIRKKKAENAIYTNRLNQYLKPAKYLTEKNLNNVMINAESEFYKNQSLSNENKRTLERRKQNLRRVARRLNTRTNVQKNPAFFLDPERTNNNRENVLNAAYGLMELANPTKRRKLTLNGRPFQTQPRTTRKREYANGNNNMVVNG